MAIKKGLVNEKMCKRTPRQQSTTSGVGTPDNPRHRGLDQALCEDILNGQRLLSERELMRPLVSFRKALHFIRTTTTNPGLRVQARRMRKKYNTGETVRRRT